MKNLLLLIVPLAVASAGCTATSLGRNTVNQIQTAADYRYQATLHALAMVAADPGTLPSFSLLSNGVTSVSDTGAANSATTWTGSPVRFAFEALAFTGSHSPQIQWTVDPVADSTQLEAMRCACRWVLEGPFSLDEDCLHILDDPESDLTPGAHFGVAQRLVRLPEHWLGVGRACDVPPGACYRDHCGDKYVWVMPDGTEGLANFTLVLQDIATLNVAPSDNSLPANRTPPLLVTLWVVQNTLDPVYSVFVIDTNKPTQTVKAGQSVVWQNNTACVQTVTSTCKGNSTLCPCLFSATIQPHTCCAPVVFDQNMFLNAGGQPDGTASIEYTIASAPAPPDCPCDGCKPCKDPAPPKCPAKTTATITLQAPNPLYAPTVVFRLDRVVRPECKRQIEARMTEGLSVANQITSVPIAWDEWMEWTTPYQGQRTTAKPGAATAITVPQPPTRLATPLRLLSSPVRAPGGTKSPPAGPLKPELEPSWQKSPPAPAPIGPTNTRERE